MKNMNLRRCGCGSDRHYGDVCFTTIWRQKTAEINDLFIANDNTP